MAVLHLESLIPVLIGVYIGFETTTILDYTLPEVLARGAFESPHTFTDNAGMMFHNALLYEHDSDPIGSISRLRKLRRRLRDARCIAERVNANRPRVSTTRNAITERAVLRECAAIVERFTDVRHCDRTSVAQYAAMAYWLGSPTDHEYVAITQDDNFQWFSSYAQLRRDY